MKYYFSLEDIIVALYRLIIQINVQGLHTHTHTHSEVGSERKRESETI